MRYLRRVSKYQKSIKLFDLTSLVNMVDLIGISVKSLKIDIRWSLEKIFTELICMNP